MADPRDEFYLTPEEAGRKWSRLNQNTNAKYDSEFPSLSGAPQQQYQNPGQAVWATANQRVTQHTPVQRPQQSQPNAPGLVPVQPQPHSTQEQLQQSLDDAFFSSTQISNTMDDYRHGGQGGVGQLSGSHQPQPGSIDDFPPLNRNGHGEIGQDRRGNVMQSAAASAFPSNSAFASGSLTMRMTAETMRGGQNGSADSIKNTGNGESSIFSSLQDPLNMKNDSFPDQQRRQSTTLNNIQSSRAQQFQPGFGGDLEDSPGGVQNRTKTPLSQMNDLDRFGLAGLLETIRSDNPDVSGLAIGQDLTSLGLDLNSQEPLHPTFGGPFAQFPTRPLQPDFTLPTCYTVLNVHKLDEKISSFSDETLFYMFYTMPRDVMQEVAAIELTGRNWRYHKELKVWLTKDPQFGDPQPISHEAERGRYVVFNEKMWQRESRDMVLRWADLDTHISNRGANMS
ncbi:hypothetical protein MMC32_007729 [Xylographa parallela]|nr:hypothetical protein [Xylographa parallela]